MRGPRNTQNEPTTVVSVRMPLDLHEQLRQLALTEMRTLNNYLVHILTDHANQEQ